MTRIRGTRKLLKFLGAIVDESVEKIQGGSLGDWHANLVWMERKKCILFANDKTLFCFMVLDVKKKDIEDLRLFFVENLRKALSAVGIPIPITSKLLLNLGNISVARTNNRSALGSMNDYAFQYNVHIFEGGGINKCDLRNITILVNKSPMRAIGHESGTRKLMENLEQYYT